MAAARERFVDDVLRHFSDNLKLNDAIACAGGVTSDPRAVIDLIYPLMTRRARPDLRHLYVAVADHRLLAGILDTVSAHLLLLQTWTVDAIRHVLTNAAAIEKANLEQVRTIVSICILFEPSPLDPVTSMMLLGKAESCKRCENVAEMIRLAHRVS
jgi:hypothetical protein